jgi:hypothetical protein
VEDGSQGQICKCDVELGDVVDGSQGQICKCDVELGDVVDGSQGQIVGAVVNHAMEHRQHPVEPVVSLVMREVKVNGEQVTKEGAVNAGLIDTGIGTFLTNVSVQPGTSVASEVDVDFYFAVAKAT